jgi:hypothetical protein
VRLRQQQVPRNDRRVVQLRIGIIRQQPVAFALHITVLHIARRRKTEESHLIKLRLGPRHVGLRGSVAVNPLCHGVASISNIQVVEPHVVLWWQATAAVALGESRQKGGVQRLLLERVRVKVLCDVVFTR